MLTTAIVILIGTVIAEVTASGIERGLTHEELKSQGRLENPQ